MPPQRQRRYVARSPRADSPWGTATDPRCQSRSVWAERKERRPSSHAGAPELLHHLDRVQLAQPLEGIDGDADVTAVGVDQLALLALWQVK